MLGSPISGPVEMMCECCDRRLLRSELMSCAECSRSVIKRHRVVVSAVSLPRVYAMCDRESRDVIAEHARDGMCASRQC